MLCVEGGRGMGPLALIGSRNDGHVTGLHGFFCGFVLECEAPSAFDMLPSLLEQSQQKMELVPSTRLSTLANSQPLSRPSLTLSQLLANC